MIAHRGSFLVTVAVVLAGVVAADAWLQPDPGRRNLEIFTEMAYSQAYESFSANEFFANGRTLQPLVEGVVPVGRLPFLYGDGPEEAQRAGRELSSPLAADDAGALAAGARSFAIFCVPCHDARGSGQGGAVLRGMLPPPSLHGARAVAMADGEMFHILTRGQGNMASYAAQLSPLERWQVIVHVRRLQQEGR